jgi:hypothetical protein
MVLSYRDSFTFTLKKMSGTCGKNGRLRNPKNPLQIKSSRPKRSRKTTDKIGRLILKSIRISQ